MIVDLDDISKLILRRFQGKLTKEETDLLEAWMQEKKERRDLVNELCDQLRVNEHLRLYSSFDIRKGWGKVRWALLKKRFHTVKIAAVVLLCLGASIFYLYQEAQLHRHKEVLSLADIHSGSKQAVLILGDGEEVDLQEEKQAQQPLYGDGWQVEKGGKLCYTSFQQRTEEKEVWHTLRVPRGGEYILSLEDGTEVRMNSESELKYPIHFGRKGRKVILSGEAYFNVTHDTTRAFVVETERMDIRVLGTSFNVMAYPNEKTAYTTLVEGKVEVRSKDELSKPMILQPGWQVACRPEGWTINEVDTDLLTAWIQGRFAFKSEELEMVLRKLERWYDVEFLVKEESIRKKRFTGNVSRYEDITRILKMLELTTNIRFQVVGDKITVVKIENGR